MKQAKEFFWDSTKKIWGLVKNAQDRLWDPAKKKLKDLLTKMSPNEAYKLFIQYEMKEGEDLNTDRAADAFFAAFKGNHGIAIRILANQEPNPLQAMILYLKAAAAGDKFSYYLLAQRFHQDDLQAKIKCLEKAELQPDALFELAQIYHKEFKNGEKEGEAELNIYLAAAQGNEKAAKFLKAKKLPLKIKILEWRKRTGSQAKAWRDNLLGKYLFSSQHKYKSCLWEEIGLGVEQNSLKAQKCLEELNDVNAIVALAKRHYHGIRTGRNFTEAAKLLLRAAERSGDPTVFYYLSKMAAKPEEFGLPDEIELGTEEQYLKLGSLHGSVECKTELKKRSIEDDWPDIGPIITYDEDTQRFIQFFGRPYYEKLQSLNPVYPYCFWEPPSPSLLFRQQCFHNYDIAPSDISTNSITPTIPFRLPGR